MASDPLNYYIGKGIVSWKPDGGSYADLGNAPTFEFTPNLTQLDHFSSRQGTKTRDRRVVTEKSATVKFVLEEFTADNLALALLGTNTGGTIDIFSESELLGSLKFEGANDVGATVVVEFPIVTLTPSAAIAFIGEGWGSLELTGDVSADPGTGSFGSLVYTAP